MELADLTAHLMEEAREEVGLLPEDLAELRPVSFCREMARGGKPQLFFCAITQLTRRELADRRKHASRVVHATGGWPELERDRWYRSTDVVLTGGRVREGLATGGITLEGAAALYFGGRYLRTLATAPRAGA